MILVGVDVGGTFTDCVLHEPASGRTVTHKVPTTPFDPSEGVIRGIAELCERAGVPRDAVTDVRHGTTTATNAVLEHEGAEAGLITTAGYRDILHIGRHQRPQHYSIRQEIPWQDRPLVKRRHRIGVAERLAPPKGEVLVPLDEDAVRAAARQLRDAGVTAIAIGFLFAYLNPAHERRAAEIVRAEHPEAFVTTSAAVSPQFREFERFTTTAMNAFIGPKVQRYVAHLARALRAGGFAAELHVMTSSGGVATPAMIAERPVLTLLSGPAAGVLGGGFAGALSDRDRLITFDVGGTSADIALVVDGQFVHASARDTQIAGFPVMLPMIDIHTIGAGGGSIAHLGAGGAFKVGPKSAGARPGPAAYGHGGSEATVTDAHVVLGRLAPDHFLGGAMALDVEAARRAVGTFAETAGLGLEEAASGILHVINANMANAIRSRTVEKGIDPREFALVAFGGAGPLHGCEVAEMLDVTTVIVPPHPGITSAVGLLTTDLRYDQIRTAFQPSTELDLTRLNADLEAAEAEITAQFEADGVAASAVRFVRTGELRYLGQGYELQVPLPAGRLDEAAMAGVIDAFHARHEAEYGHGFPDKTVEIVNLRIAGVGRGDKVAAPPPLAGGDLAAAQVHATTCLFRSEAGLERVATPLYERDRLPVGRPFDGPAIVLQADATTVVPPGWRAVAEARGNLVLTRSA
ncbi:MAG: hydantoinase/oxoprolinase family protein [Alphaproteobacteria bacterium]